MLLRGSPKKVEAMVRDDVKNPKYLSTIVTSCKSQHRVLLSVQLPFCHLIVFVTTTSHLPDLVRSIFVQSVKSSIAGGNFLRLG